MLDKALGTVLSVPCSSPVLKWLEAYSLSGFVAIPRHSHGRIVTHKDILTPTWRNLVPLQVTSYRLPSAH